MYITVTYEDSDISNALRKIIKDPNGEEFVKLLTPLICSNSNAVQYLFKLMIGNKLPEVIPNGSLCKIKVDNLGYGSRKDLIREKFADSDDKVVVTVTQFRGHHEYSEYSIEYKNVLENGDPKTETTYVTSRELEIIDDF
jgi:hypothetical protein